MAIVRIHCCSGVYTAQPLFNTAKPPVPAAPMASVTESNVFMPESNRAAMVKSVMPR